MGRRGPAFPYKGAAKRISKIAAIPRAKLKNYLLYQSKDKDDTAILFASLGYNMKNRKRLERDIRKGLLKNKPVFQKATLTMKTSIR